MQAFQYYNRQILPFEITVSKKNINNYKKIDVFNGRLWRSVKYEEVYLHAYESVAEARGRIGRYFVFYNTERKHQTLKMTPDQAYNVNLMLTEAA